MCSILRKSFRSTLFASSRNSDLTEMKLQLLNSSIEVTYWTHRHYTNYFSLPLTLSFLLLEAKPGIGQIHLFVALKFFLAQPFPNRFIKSQWKMIWDAMKRYNRSEMRERRWRARHWENTVAPGQSEVVGVWWNTAVCGRLCRMLQWGRALCSLSLSFLYHTVEQRGAQVQKHKMTFNNKTQQAVWVANSHETRFTMQ